MARRVGITSSGSVGSSSRGIAFVFQGGGSLTSPEVGMLRALTDADIYPDFVVGSSAGALNAVAFASNPTTAGVTDLQALWMTLRRRAVAPLSAHVFVPALLGRRDGLLSNIGLRRVVESSYVPTRLESTAIPVHVVATDLATGSPVLFSQGDTATAVLASCAFPGLYPPVSVDGRRLIDGGVCADAPVLQAERLGADIIFVLSAAMSDSVRPPRGALPLAYNALGQILDAAVRRDVDHAQATVHVLPAATTRASSPVDFRDTARLIEEGHRLATNWLRDHLSNIPANTTSASAVSPV